MRWTFLHMEALDRIESVDSRVLGMGGYAQPSQLLPQVVAGALKAWLLTKEGYDFKRKFAEQSWKAQERARSVRHPEADNNEPKDVFQFAGPFFRMAGRGNLLFPEPANLQHDPEQAAPTDQYGRLAYPGETIPLSGGACADLNLCRYESHAVEACSCHISYKYLACLLLRLGLDNKEYTDLREGVLGSPTYDPVLDKDIYQRERNIGHQRTENGTVKQGMLYSTSSMRFCDPFSPQTRDKSPTAIAGFYSGPPLPEEPFDLRLGSNGHRVLTTQDMPFAREVSLVFGSLKDIVKEKILAGCGLLVYLATPAIFEAGWRPPEFEGMRLESAVVQRPLIVGGWDMHLKRPKPMYRAAQGGSMFFYRIEDMDRASAFIDDYHFNKSISWRYGEQGYGICLMGVWTSREQKNTSGALS